MLELQPGIVSKICESFKVLYLVIAGSFQPDVDRLDRVSFTSRTPTSCSVQHLHLVSDARSLERFPGISPAEKDLHPARFTARSVRPATASRRKGHLAVRDGEGAIAGSRSVLVPTDPQAHSRPCRIRLTLGTQGGLQVAVTIDVGNGAFRHVGDEPRVDGLSQSVRVAESDGGCGLRKKVTGAELGTRGRNGCPAQVVGRIAHEAESMARVHADDAHTGGQAGEGETLTGVRFACFLKILARCDVVVDDRARRRVVEPELRDAEAGSEGGKG